MTIFFGGPNLKIFLACAIGLFPSLSAADTCPGQIFSAKPDLTAPGSVPNGALASYVNENRSWADGIKISVDQRDDELWLDVTEYPGTAAVAAAMRVVWLLARVSSGNQKRLVFADEGRGLFQIDSAVAKDIGCRFVIGENGGENPIALMREFYDALEVFQTGRRVAPLYNGSLLGDTMTAMTVNNEIFVPKWIVSAVK